MAQEYNEKMFLVHIPSILHGLLSFHDFEDYLMMEPTLG
jgi:hypothetical protein